MNKNRKQQMRGKQGRKDNSSKRVNFDNERESRFEKDMEDKAYPKGAKKTGKCNDPIWYAHNPELLRAAASIPFTWTTGMPLPWMESQLGARWAVPGVMTQYWTPYVGLHDDTVVAAANSMYSYVVHANSRTTVYDPNDLMILVLAGAQVFSALSLGIKAYGLLRRYDQQDAYTPEGILTGMGFNYQDLRANAANMWFDLNQLVAQVQQIWIPNTMPIIERWFWLNANLYRDGDSVKSQYYQFAPAVFYQYSETTSQRGGSLIPIPWMMMTDNESTPSIEPIMPTMHTWAQYLDIVTDMITALLNSQDRGIIFGDILKAYGADRLYSIAPVSVDYTVEAVYDKEVLSQIENSTTFPNLFYNKGSDNVTVVRSKEIGAIVQKAGQTGLIHNFYEASIAVNTTIKDFHNYGAPYELPLNFHQVENPTPEQIMVATRLRSAGMKVLAYSANAKSAYYGPAVAGTEVIVWQSVAIRKAGSTSSSLRRVTWNSNVHSSILPMKNIDLLQTFEYNAFDWCNFFITSKGVDLVIPSNKPNTATIPPVYNEADYIALDYDNYTILNASDLEKMHTTAVYSLFGVPSMI